MDFVVASPYSMPPSPMPTPYSAYGGIPSLPTYTSPIPGPNNIPGYPVPGHGHQPWDMLGPSGIRGGYPPTPDQWDMLPPSAIRGYPPSTTPPPVQWEMLPPSAQGRVYDPATSVNPPYPTYPQQAAHNTGTITEEHIRASLLSAVEDKVRQSMKENVAQWVAEFETLQKIQSELTQGKERINHLMTALEREQSEWEKVLTTLRDKDLELDAALLNISNQGELDVDEAVVTTAPLYKQYVSFHSQPCINSILQIVDGVC